MPGELYLAGAHTGRGYLDRPDLTASRFVTDPFGEGGRMYRTGDLARWRSDGQLEFIGRSDGQIKLRGLRIELGEIEAVLSSHPAVRRAVLVVDDRNLSGRQLHAFVQVSAIDESLPAELRRLASRSLPDYMVPAGIELVESLPLTPNGKVDRARLQPSTAARTAEFQPPEGALQVALCTIFTDLLAADRVGVEDNFFDLGGHSLLATRLTSRIREQLQARLSIRDIFECPTVLALADRIQGGRQDDGQADVLLPLRAGGSRAPLFCVHPAIGLSWVYAPLPRLLDLEQPVYGLQSPGLHAGAQQPASITELAATYLTAIRRRQPSGPYQLLGWSYGAGVAHEITAQLEQLGEQVSLLVMLDGYPPNPAPHRVLAAGDPENLAMLLGSVGQPVPAGRLDLAGYRDLARSPGGPLAGLDDELIEALPAVFAHNLNLLSEFRPQSISADVLYFDALADKDEQAPTPTNWAPYLTGRFDVVPLDCTHAGVLAPLPLAEIAATLRPLLDPDRTSDRPPVPFSQSPYRRPLPKMRKSS